jgi:sugar phosphate isomerase/epimerase
VKPFSLDDGGGSTNGERIVSLASLTLDYMSPPDIVSAAAEAGFAWVSLHITGPSRPGDSAYDMLGDTPLVRTTRRRLADTGLSVLDVEALKIRPDTLVREYESFFETAARLGARNAQAMSLDPDEARAADTFAAICELAAAYGLRVALEFTVLSEVRSVGQAVRLVRRTARPEAGILLDSLHFSRSGGRLDDLLPSDWDRFFYVQLCDAPASIPTEPGLLLQEATSDRLFPGRGELDLKGLLEALPPDIPISVECPDRSVAHMAPVDKARLALATTSDLLAGGHA